MLFFDNWLRLCLVRVKVFPENRYFSEMLFSGKENVFMCLVAFQKMFQKIFSNVWLCSWKYHRKHIFYLLLTFSHIFSVTKQIHNIIHSSKHKQNPEKKSSNPNKRRRDCNWRDHNRDRNRHVHTIAIEASRDASIVIAIDADWHGAGDRAVPARSQSLLSLSLSLSLFYFPRPEVIWSENRNENDFPAFWLWNLVNWKCFSVWPNLK